MTYYQNLGCQTQGGKQSNSSTDMDME